MINHINQLCKFGERQGSDEIATRHYIEHVLKLFFTSYVLEEFQAGIPAVHAHELVIDGCIIQSEFSSFVGGLFNQQSDIISSLKSDFIPSGSIINYNPKCKNAISRATFYSTPSLAIKACDINYVKNAKSISGFVTITKHNFKSANILVGNYKNPETIIFTHYDSINNGAVDNASGVAVLLKLIEIFPEIFKTTLLVFSGNEELSFDQPVYWGHGYREFEKKYSNLLKFSKRIIVIDCVGHAKPKLNHEKELIYMGLPLVGIRSYVNKTCALSADYDKLMTFYHSPIDTPKQINKLYMVEALKELIANIK